MCLATQVSEFPTKYLTHASDAVIRNSVSKGNPTFYDTGSVVILFTIVRLLSLFWSRSVQSTAPYSWSSILTVRFPLNLNLPSGLFPSAVPTLSVYAPLISHTWATRPSHLILFHIIIQIILGEERGSWHFYYQVFFVYYFISLRPEYLPQQPIL